MNVYIRNTYYHMRSNSDNESLIMQFVAIITILTCELKVLFNVLNVTRMTFNVLTGQIKYIENKYVKGK